MAGCECKYWQNILNPPDKWAREAWPPGTLLWDMFEDTWLLQELGIWFCPWCGTKLTPPEDTDD